MPGSTATPVVPSGSLSRESPLAESAPFLSSMDLAASPSAEAPVADELVLNPNQPIRNFFKRMWWIIRKSRVQLADLGHKSITNAQSVLSDMRDDLKGTWHFEKELYDNPTRLLIAFLGKLGYSALTLVISPLSAAAQVAFGSLCLTLSFDFIPLAIRLFNTAKSIVIEGWEVLKVWLNGAWNGLCKVASKVTAAIVEYGAKFIAACRNKLSSLVSLLNRGLEAAWEGIKFVGRKIGESLSSALESLQVVARHIARAAVNLAIGIGQLLWGVTKAAYSITKGSVIAVAALFIETGADNLVRGPAKAVMILDIAVAAAIGSLLDGLYSFTKAIGLTGRQRFISRSIENENDNQSDILLEDEVQPSMPDTISGGLEPKEDTWYYNKTLKNGADRFNRSLLWLGDRLYKSYADQKVKLLGRDLSGYETARVIRYGADDLLHPSGERVRESSGYTVTV